MSNNHHELGDEERFQVKVAWLYHTEGLTQAVIAEQLGVTRLRINRALADASKNGIIRVQINSPYSPCLSLETEVQERFDLEDVSIVPMPSDDSNVQATVGAELGRYLSRMLKRTEIQRFGIAWGSTLNFATRSMMSIERRDLEIISVMGGLPEGSGVNSFEIVTRLSELLSSRRTYFTAPLYASSKQSRDTIMVQEIFQEVLAKIRSVDAIALGVGDVTARSLLIRDGLPRDISVESLVTAGAVGDLLGCFVNSDGESIDHPVNRRVIGIHPTELRTMPNVILAAGGQNKLKIMTAALKMKIFNILVTDQRTAESLLKIAD